MNIEKAYKKIKVLFCIEQASISYKYYENIFIELNKLAAIDIEVFNLIRDEEVNQHLAQFCSKVYTLPNDKPYKSQVFNIKKIIRQSHPQIIHAHEVIPGFYAAMGLFVCLSNTKLIFHRHHSFYRNKATRFMERIAFFRCNLAVSVSKTMQNRTFSEHPFGKKKIAHLYNGINIMDNGLPLPIEIKRYDNYHKIVFLARLRSRKGHDTAIGAIDIVRNKIPNIILFIAGDGNLRKDIERMIAKNNLQENIILLGDVQNIKALLDEVVISILPSESEAFNLSILETLACNRLSIASDLPSIMECIEDRKTGVLIKPGNAKQLAEKIIYYLENKIERNEIAANGYQLYNNKFTAKLMAEKMTSIYTRLIAGPKRPISFYD